jgi:uncharacterized protein YdeI (YjbR/CyaY-like superfamily)
MNPATDPRVDAYIEKSAEFARPILRHSRKLVHQACPEAAEDIKWGMPFFTRHGNLCHMAAFKAHCGFGFWHHGMKAVLNPDPAKAEEAMGSFGRVTRLTDLPDDRRLLKLVRAAAKLNESGQPARAVMKPRPAPKMPFDLAAALKKNPAAAITFANFSPSHRREYIEWVTEAKRPETRAKRLAATLAQLTEGKSRHWKDQGG